MKTGRVVHVDRNVVDTGNLRERLTGSGVNDLIEQAVGRVNSREIEIEDIDMEDAEIEVVIVASK